MFIIYSLTPDEFNNEHKHVVEIFDTQEDAEYVLKALEKVNISFNAYRIEEMGR